MNWCAFQASPEPRSGSFGLNVEIARPDQIGAVLTDLYSPEQLRIVPQRRVQAERVHQSRHVNRRIVASIPANLQAEGPVGGG
jgi:hypothetical protein